MCYTSSDTKGTNMKKVICILLIVFTLCSLYASSNSQKIYAVDSSVYRDISNLYLVLGYALPSTSGPWSGDELLKMVSLIDRDSLSDVFKVAYDSVLSELEGEREDISFDGGAVNFSGTLNLDLYAHAYNSDDIKRTDINGIEETAFTGRRYWFGRDLTKNNPFFVIDWETYLGSRFYTFFNAYLANSVRGKKEIGSTRLNSNIPTLQNLFDFDLKLLDINFPSRAFFSTGGSGWSVEIGRDRLSWGSGTTGNLVLSDNFPYHDMVRFSAYSSKFKYSYLVSFFPHKSNYYDTGWDNDSSTCTCSGCECPVTTSGTCSCENCNGKCGSAYGYDGDNYNDSSRKLKGISFYAAHRFEARFFSDKLTLSVTEALMYESESGSLQIAALSPMYFMHNAYMPSNSNSTLAFEINWTPVKGLALYAQILLDNFAMPGFESSPGPEKSEAVTPDAKGYMIGAKYVTTINKGILTVNPEVVYVTPYTYLRDPGLVEDGRSEASYGLDYIAAVKYRLYSYESYAGHSDILYDEYVVGYTYGPDSLVANLNIEWQKERLSLGGKAFFMMHGTHDLWTIWTTVPAGTTKEDYNNQFSGITTDHSNTGNYRYGDEAKKRNSIWYTFDIGLSAEYELLDNLSFNASIDFVLMKNIYNIKGQDASDFQLILGASWKPF